jgi:hypothetical protein
MDSWDEKTMELGDGDLLEVDVADELREEEWFAEGDLLGLLYE